MRTSPEGNPPFLLCMYKISDSNRTLSRTEDPQPLVYQSVVRADSSQGQTPAVPLPTVHLEKSYVTGPAGLAAARSRGPLPQHPVLAVGTRGRQTQIHWRVTERAGLQSQGEFAKSPSRPQERHLQWASASSLCWLWLEMITGSEISKVFTISWQRTKNTWAPGLRPMRLEAELPGDRALPPSRGNSKL